MSSPLNSRHRHAYRHSINILALSIVLYASGIAAPIQEAEGAFIASNSPSLFAKKNNAMLPSSRPLPMPLSMSTDENNEEEPVSGSFFNEVPPPKADDDKEDDVIEIESEITSSSTSMEFGGGDMEMFEQIIKKTRLSTNGGGKGFSKTTSTTDHAAPSIIQTTSTDGQKQSFVGIGKPMNDVRNPEYDENGYTLYADETTGEKKRVFEALVEYPSVFKMKIVGKDDPEGSFAPEIVNVVAKSCGVESSMVKNTTRKNGKWTSVTVHAPVKNADMLYALYENVDKDPRVKFKF